MAINYSLTQRHNPADSTADPKVYALAQYTVKMSLEDFSQHIADHGSPFTRDVILGTLTAAVDCLREQLLSGIRVSLGDLGTFYVSLNSEGTDTAEEFTSKNIKKVKVNWSRGSRFTTLTDDATFQYVGTRKAQAAARKAEKEAIDNGTTADHDTEPGEETGGSGDGGGLQE